MLEKNPNILHNNNDTLHNNNDTLHNRNLAELHRLCDKKNWGYDNFKGVLLLLSQMGNGQRIPGYLRPESIDLKGLSSIINDLIKKTDETGLEHARTIFTDLDKGSLIAGVTTRGDKNSVRLDLTPQSGRENFQIPVGSIHTHPLEIYSHGLSPQDYEVFLSDHNQQAMIITYGHNIMMVLKTSATPERPDNEYIKKIVNENENDFILTSIVNFNKEVCSQLGLIMYISSSGKDKDLIFNRVNVISE